MLPYMKEEWRDLPGYTGIYQISSSGRIKRLARSYERVHRGITQKLTIKERITIGTMAKVGYRLASLGHRKRQYIHRLVCEAFHGPPPNPNMDAAHCDGNKLNNAASNLRWATRKENIHDLVKHGRRRRGEDLPFTKISDEMVRKIRNSPEKSGYRWAKDLGVSVGTVNSIRRGEERIHVL